MQAYGMREPFYCDSEPLSTTPISYKVVLLLDIDIKFQVNMPNIHFGCDLKVQYCRVMRTRGTSSGCVHPGAPNVPVPLIVIGQLLARPLRLCC